MRGLCLIISMSPLLFFVPPEAFAQLPHFLGWILLAALLAALGAWPGFTSFRFLPVGIASSFMASFNSMLVCLYGFLLFKERLSFPQLAVIGGIILLVVLLGMSRSTIHFAQLGQPRKGIALCLLFGLLVSCAFVILSYVSRNLNPLLTAYAWEACIAIFSVIINGIRKSIYRRPLFTITAKDTLRTFLYSWPTLIGTGCYMLAVTLGPISIVAAIGSTTIVTSTLLARLLYREQLRRYQWALLLAICIMLALLRLLGMRQAS